MALMWFIAIVCRVPCFYSSAAFFTWTLCLKNINYKFPFAVITDRIFKMSELLSHCCFRMHVHGISTVSCMVILYTRWFATLNGPSHKISRPETDAVYKGGWLLFHVSGKCKHSCKIFWEGYLPTFCFNSFLQNSGKYEY